MAKRCGTTKELLIQLANLAFEITVCLSASKIASRLPITDNTLTASGCY